MPRQETEPELQQLAFDGLDALEPEKTIIECCVVTRDPTYSKRTTGANWDCMVFAPPDLFHQDQHDTYQLHASTYASQAKKKHLRCGDVVTVTGTLTMQHVTLQNGATEIVKHLAVSDLLVVSRSPRKTITVFEAEQKKQP